MEPTLLKAHEHRVLRIDELDNRRSCALRHELEGVHFGEAGAITHPAHHSLERNASRVLESTGRPNEMALSREPREIVSSA